MSKTIDLDKTVSELCHEYPEIKDIMVKLGFKDITKPMALATVGKVMTIPKGAAIKGINLAEVIETFKQNGFEIQGSKEDEKEIRKAKEAEVQNENSTDDGANQRAGLLKEYIARLSAGEDLESVRKDFVENFESVDAAEIAKAEQELIQGGTPVSEVQKLCDVHSALFHGATKEEQIENAEKAVMDSINNRDAKEKDSAAEFSKIKGHPVNVFMAENENILTLIEALKKAMKEEKPVKEIVPLVQNLRAVSIHYARKGDLIYPLLNRKYGFSGPSNVMWGVDDEIRDELKVLADGGNMIPGFTGRLEKVVTRAEEMIYKENNILFPLCIQQFSDEDWMRIYYEMPSYETLLTDGYPTWEEAESRRESLKTVGGKTVEELNKDGKKESLESGYITLGAGHMTREQIEAVLNTIPMELTFVDEDNINRYFDDGEKLFKRPDMAIDRDVFSCHPPRYEMMVRHIIDEFKSGENESVDIWMEKNNEPVLVKYMAVRDSNGKYVGTLEAVQKMGFAKEHFEE